MRKALVPMGGAQVQSLTPTPPIHFGPLKGGGGKNTNRYLVPGLSFEGGIFNERQTIFVPICPHGRGKIDVATESEVAAQILPSLGPRENAKKQLSTLSINTWGDRFSQPL